MSERIAVGVDIGTTKVGAVVASTDESGNVNILGVGVAPSEGLHRGVVVNIDKTVTAIKTAVEEAARAAGVEVQSVVVGIAGDHITSFDRRSDITVSKLEGEINDFDIERLLDDACDFHLPADRKIIHAIPQQFIIDGQDGVPDPRGMSGLRLASDVHLVTGTSAAIKTLRACVNKAGFDVSDIVLEPIASSYAVLHPDEREVGIGLIDIGGGTTDIAIFEEGFIRYTGIAAVAGNHVTEDIRKGLGVLRDQAERLKRQFGLAMLPAGADQEAITIDGIAGRGEKIIGLTDLGNVIQPRLAEILEIAGMEIKRSGFGRHLAAGIVLTGGGSLIPGTAELATEILGVETRIGVPLELGGGLTEKVDSPQFATAVGLVLYALRPEDRGLFRSQMSGDAPRTKSKDGSAGFGSRIKKSISRWFDEM